MKNLNVLHIRYNEDLKENPESTILKINSFLGYDHLSAEDAIKIRDLTSYDRMKMSHPNKVHTKTQGKSGTYKSKLTERNIRDINNRMANFLDEWNSMNMDLSMYCTDP